MKHIVENEFSTTLFALVENETFASPMENLKMTTKRVAENDFSSMLFPLVENSNLTMKSIAKNEFSTSSELC